MPLSKQRKESMYKYAKEKLKRIPLDVQKEKYEKIKAHADKKKESVNGYIKKAIDMRMESDNINFQNNTNLKELGNTNMSDFNMVSDLLTRCGEQYPTPAVGI